MKPVLVTGATGRLGANLVRALIGKGRAVRSLVMPGDKLERKLSGLGTEIVHGDLLDRESILTVCEGVEAIIHCAAVMASRSPGMSDTGQFDVNTRGTLLLLDAAVEHHVRRFVFVSSTSVFDTDTTPHDQMPIREDTPQRPGGFYGVTKVAAEALVRGCHFQCGLPTVILRPNAILACEEPAQIWRVGYVANRLKRFATDPKSSMYVPGVENPAAPVEALGLDPQTPCVPKTPDGRPWQLHAVDVRDVVQAVLSALEKPEAVGEDFNIAGPLPMDFEIAARHLAERTGVDCAEVTIPNLLRFWYDLSKAEKLLGYEPQYDIRRMIDDALAFQKGEDIGVLPAT